MSVHRDIELSDQIIVLLRDEAPDDQISALTATIVRMKLFGVAKRASPEAQAVVERLIAGFAPAQRS